MVIKPVSKKSLFEEVSEQIIQLIQEGSFKLGEKLPGENSLSDSFNVSRNSIRESLKALQLTGILTSKPGKGTYVSEKALRNIHNMELMSIIENESTLIELMETRLIIEPDLVYLATKRITDKDIKKLEAVIEKGQKALAEKNYSFDIGMEFHMLILEISRNRILGDFMKSITDHLIAQRGKLMLKHLSEYILEVEMAEHEKMLELIKNGEAEKAKDSMRKHIANSMQIIMEKQKNELQL